MGFVSNTIKKIVFWNYPRTSWQWDVLCVLILVFIFLTPKSWFANTSYRQEAPKEASTIVILPAEDFGPQPLTEEIERRAKEVAHRPEAQHLTIQPEGEGGKIRRYKVDIR
jgi:hypothetical protein